jgi:hypothetical protein
MYCLLPEVAIVTEKPEFLVRLESRQRPCVMRKVFRLFLETTEIGTSTEKVFGWYRTQYSTVGVQSFLCQIMGPERLHLVSNMCGCEPPNLQQ